LIKKKLWLAPPTRNIGAPQKIGNWRDGKWIRINELIRGDDVLEEYRLAEQT